MTWKEFRNYIDSVLGVLEAAENVQIDFIQIKQPLHLDVSVHYKGNKAMLRIKDQMVVSANGETEQKEFF